MNKGENGEDEREYWKNKIMHSTNDRHFYVSRASVRFMCVWWWGRVEHLFCVIYFDVAAIERGGCMRRKKKGVIKIKKNKKNVKKLNINKKKKWFL